METNKVTIIIPVHEYNEAISNYLSKALESIDKQENIEFKPIVLVVAPPSVCLELETDDKLPKIFKVVVNNGKTDYQSQVNLAVDSVESPYFSILEFDDEYSQTYFKNVERYVTSYPETDIFLTMMIEVNDLDQGIKLTNETVWSQQFVGENGEMGYLNIGSLKQYTDFKLSGGIIKTSEFLNLGKLKVNILMTFAYELLLRALNNTCKIFIIPKIGYKHLATRADSMFGQYQLNMPVQERKFWFDTAVKEANFTNDRDIDTSKLNKVI